MVNTVAQLKIAVKPILKNAGVKKMSLFGSFARGDHHDDSDVDMLVEFAKPVGLFSFSDLKNKLEQKLKRKVDLVSNKGISPLIQRYIDQDKVNILWKRKIFPAGSAGVFVLAMVDKILKIVQNILVKIFLGG